MKILVITEYYPPKVFGGGELSARALARGLSEKGHDVTVLTSSIRGMKEEDKDKKVKVCRRLATGDNPHSLLSNLKRAFVFPGSLRRALKGLDADVIHCANTTSILPFRHPKMTVATINSYVPFCPKGNLFYNEKVVCDGPSLLKCCGCIARSRYVGKARIGAWLRLNPIFWAFLYMTYRRRHARLENMDRIIVVSEFMRRFVDDKRAELVYNIVDESVAKRRFTLPKGRGKAKIGFIGSLDRIKGVDLLLEAAKHVDGDFYIIGDGPEMERLKAMAGKNVRFTGKLAPDFMPSIYKQLDIVVIPSLWPEPFSRVALEALHNGKPIVATDVGGNRDVVIDGKTGFLCIPSAEDIVRRLSQLAADKGLRTRMGLEAKRFYSERLDRNKLLDSIISIYRRKG